MKSGVGRFISVAARTEQKSTMLTIRYTAIFAHNTG